MELIKSLILVGVIGGCGIYLLYKTTRYIVDICRAKSIFQLWRNHPGFKFTVTIFASVAMVWAVSFFYKDGTGTEQSNTPANQTLATSTRDLDDDTTPVASCTSDAVAPFALSTVSHRDTAAICEKMARTMGANPSVRLLRRLSKTVSLLSELGRTNDIAGEAYQFMRIAESRGQLKSDDAMISTFETVFKIVNGTDGRVKPKDLSIFLGSVRPGAMTMSDEGLINSASVISVMKQDSGG